MALCLVAGVPDFDALLVAVDVALALQSVDVGQCVVLGSLSECLSDHFVRFVLLGGRC